MQPRFTRNGGVARSSPMTYRMPSAIAVRSHFGKLSATSF